MSEREKAIESLKQARDLVNLACEQWSGGALLAARYEDRTYLALVSTWGVLASAIQLAERSMKIDPQIGGAINNYDRAPSPKS